MPETHADLEVQQNLAFERKWFRFEHLCWFLMALLIAAAVGGFAGPGPWSRRTLEDPATGTRLEYERLLRARAPVEIRIHAGPALTAKENLEIHLAGSLAGVAPMRQSLPAAAGHQALAGSSRLVYSVAPGAGADIVLTQAPDAPGPKWSRISFAGGPSFHIDQFVLP